MPRKSPEKLVKVTFNLRDGDMERLRELHPHLPCSEVIRQLVARHIAAAEVKTTPLTEQLDLPI